MTASDKRSSLLRVPHWSVFTKGLLALALAHAVLFLLILPAVSPGGWMDSVIQWTYRLLTNPEREWAGDSFEPMFAALDYENARGPNDRPLYQEIFFERRTKFQYPPTSLLPAVLLQQTAKPARYAWYASFAFVLLNIAFSVLLFGRSVRDQMGAEFWNRERLLLLALALMFAVTFYPMLQAYALGQIQTWINALLAIAIWAWVSGHEKTAGVLTAIACLIKPTYAPVVLWSAIRRRWGFFAAAVVSGAAGLLVSILVFGWQDHLDYLPVLSHLSQRGESFFPNQSVNGVLNRLLGNGPNLQWDAHDFPPFRPLVYGVTIGTAVVMLAGFLLWPAVRKWPLSRFEFPLGLLIVTVASPIAWEHHYGILLPVFAMLAPVVFARGSGAQSAWLALAYLITANVITVAQRAAALPYGLNILQSYLFFGALVVLALSWKQLSPAEAQRR
jgi:hypothetical protein